MKSIFLVLRVTENGQVTGRIRAFQTEVEAVQVMNDLNDFYWRTERKTYFIMEEVEIG